MLMDCQIRDPNRGAFDPQPHRRDLPMRLDKTRQDKQPVANRRRVEQWRDRIAAMKATAA